MKRSELEHLIRAAGSIADDAEIVVIGSQSILGQFPDVPLSLLVSAAADLFPPRRPELADLIDGSIGEGSPFHELYGYYTQGVGEWTAILPKGWRDHLVRIVSPNTHGVAGLCLEVHDLAISKHVAGREKDLEFTRELARQGMTDSRMLVQQLKETEVPIELGKLIEARIRRDSTQSRKRPNTGSGDRYWA